MEMNFNFAQFEELKDFYIWWEQRIFQHETYCLKKKNFYRIRGGKRIDGNIHVDYMRLRASSEKKPFYIFTLGHSTENLHFL